MATGFARRMKYPVTYVVGLEECATIITFGHLLPNQVFIDHYTCFNCTFYILIISYPLLRFPDEWCHTFILYLGVGGWIVEAKKFCTSCASSYSTIEEAKSACEQDYECNAVYDLFCDGIGSFCTCRFNLVIDQTHPKALDCIHKKKNNWSYKLDYIEEKNIFVRAIFSDSLIFLNFFKNNYSVHKMLT